MADQIRSNGTQTRRVSRTSGAGKSKRVERGAGRIRRVAGITHVDTIPRLEAQENDNSESKGLARLLQSWSNEVFTQGNFARDLQTALDYVEALHQDLPSGITGPMQMECVRILKEEVDRAEQTYKLRKGVPRA